MKQRAIKSLYVLVFVVFLFLFLVIKFPKEEIKNRLVSEIEQSSPIPVLIENVEFKAPLTLHLIKLNFVLKNGSRLEVDSLSAKPGLLSILTSDEVKIPFRASLYDGVVKGEIFYSRKQSKVTAFNADIQELDSSPIPTLISKDAKVEIGGDLNGYIKYDSDKSDKKPDPKAYYSITSDNLSINNFQIDQLSFNEDYKNLKLEFMGTIDDRLTDIENLSFVNEDFDLRFNGKMPPPWKLRQGGRLNLNMKLNVYSNKAKLALLKAFLSPDRDGSHSGRILGTVSSPRLVNTKNKLPSGT